MIRRIIAVCVPMLALVACTSPVTTPPLDSSAVLADSATQILVTIPQAASPAAGLIGAPGQAYLVRRSYDLTPSVDRSLDRIARDYGLRRVRGWYIESLGVYCEVLEVSATDPEELVTRLLEDPRVDLAQPMNFFETQGQSYDDPLLDLQTSVSVLTVEDAHEIATGNGVTVAVIDSRVDARHPDLKNRIREIRDLVDGDAGNSPEVHGTAVAGVIASAANNHEGIVGIAPDAELVALRACRTTSSESGSARCSSFSLALALEIALQLDVEVVNLSLTGPDDPLIGNLIDEALSRGVVVVAARSDDVQAPGFPASHRGVIAASTPETTLQAEANSRYPGARVVHAPGHEIISTAPQSSYAFFSGHSLAAAHVSGVAALLKERAPGLQSDDIVRLLQDTSVLVDDGRSINACRALARLTNSSGCSDAIPAIASVEE